MGAGKPCVYVQNKKKKLKQKVFMLRPYVCVDEVCKKIDARTDYCDLKQLCPHPLSICTKTSSV